MGLFKKKSVPSELPELAMDDLESGSKEVHDFLKNEEAKKTPPASAPPAAKPAAEVTSETAEKPAATPKTVPPKTEENPATPSAPAETPKPAPPAEAKPAVTPPAENPTPTNAPAQPASADEKSFFGDLQNNLNSEISDFSQFESWYKDKFEKRDVIKDMKSYWEDQKTASIISVMGKNFQQKISDKIQRLQELEKTWQAVYFDLVEKEEEIKEQELELKELLAEFVRVCKSKAASPAKKVSANSDKNAKVENAETKKTN